MLAQDILVPHSNMLLLFTSSAQTDIFPEIRIDAVRFLDVYLEHFPDLLVDGWKDGGHTHGGRILEGYLGLLNTSLMFGDPEGTDKLSIISHFNQRKRRAAKSNVNADRQLVSHGVYPLGSFDK
jgi:pre-rRNA-processing protein IPI1